VNDNLNDRVSFLFDASHQTHTNPTHVHHTRTTHVILDNIIFMGINPVRDASAIPENRIRAGCMPPAVLAIRFSNDRVSWVQLKNTGPSCPAPELLSVAGPWPEAHGLLASVAQPCVRILSQKKQACV